MVNFSKILHIYKNCGILSLFRQLKYIIPERFKFYRNDKFDLKYKTNVNNFVDSKVLYKNHQEFHSYKATNEYFFDSLLTIVIEHFQIKTSKSLLIDLGSGKGKVLLMSLKFNFYKVIGVEYSKLLFKDSLNNIEIFQSNQKQYDVSSIEVLNMDASLFTPPSFLYLLVQYFSYITHLEKR